MPVQAVPVRLAECVNRFGTARAERLVPLSGRVLVTVGEQTLLGRVLGERVTRSGRQSLVLVRGRRTWVASHRVQPLDGRAASTSPQ